MLQRKNNYTVLFLVFTLFWNYCYGFVLMFSSAGDGGVAENQFFEAGFGWEYDVETMVLLNEKGASDKDVGFVISSKILVESKWGASHEKLLKIQVSNYYYLLAFIIHVFYLFS